jgi:hypothetical protein
VRWEAVARVSPISEVTLKTCQFPMSLHVNVVNMP